jgi:hypothetical protein
VSGVKPNPLLQETLSLLVKSISRLFFKILISLARFLRISVILLGFYLADAFFFPARFPSLPL